MLSKLILAEKLGAKRSQNWPKTFLFYKLLFLYQDWSYRHDSDGCLTDPQGCQGDGEQSRAPDVGEAVEAVDQHDAQNTRKPET